MGINLQSLKYMAQGFKKVALKDTKGVLTKKNNFKWVRDRLDRIETIFPTGTRVSASKVVRPVFADKIITKPDGWISNHPV